MKDLHYAVAVVVKKKITDKEFLETRRPLDDADHPGLWGLPANNLKEGELPEDGAKRICHEKLYCEAKPVRFIGAMSQKRNTYDICLMEYEMELLNNEEPNVKKADTEGTAYIDQKWTSDPKELIESAKAGACCSTLLVTDLGLMNRDEWVTDLEGSKSVG